MIDDVIFYLSNLVFELEIWFEKICWEDDSVNMGLNFIVWRIGKKIIDRELLKLNRIKMNLVFFYKIGNKFLKFCFYFYVSKYFFIYYFSIFIF